MLKSCRNRSLHYGSVTLLALRSLACAGLVGLAVAASGCSPEAPAPSPSDDEFAQLVDSYLDAADEKGFGEEQVATLEAARAAGELSFERYSTAIDASLECISDAGFQVDRFPTDDTGGFPFVNYSYEGPEAGNPVADECITVNSEAIEAIYQMQPSSVAAKNAYLETQAADIARCLKDEGTDVNFDGLAGEILSDAILAAVNDQLATAAAAGTQPHMDCFLALSN